MQSSVVCKLFTQDRINKVGWQRARLCLNLQRLATVRYSRSACQSLQSVITVSSKLAFRKTITARYRWRE